MGRPHLPAQLSRRNRYLRAMRTDVRYPFSMRDDSDVPAPGDMGGPSRDHSGSSRVAADDSVGGTASR